MGGRGSGGSRGGGGASKSINAKTENELNYLLNKSYKYDDDAYEFSRRAAYNKPVKKNWRRNIHNMQKRHRQKLMKQKLSLKNLKQKLQN